MKFLSLKLSAAALVLFGQTAQAEWTLDGAASSFHYVTSKASAISEINSFGTLAGGIADDGTATLAIDLASVNTAIEVRDQRMRDIVFQVAQYPQATVTVAVDAAALDAMQPGTSVTATYKAAVDLHGLQADYDAELQVIKLDADTVQVQLARPLLVGAVSFGLAQAVEELKTIAGLPSINPNVVVDFALVYNKQ